MNTIEVGDTVQWAEKSLRLDGGPDRVKAGTVKELRTRKGNHWQIKEALVRPIPFYGVSYFVNLSRLTKLAPLTALASDGDVAGNVDVGGGAE